MKVGSFYETKTCGRIRILDYADSKNILVQFENTGEVYSTAKSSIMSGHVSDKTYPTICGVGFVGRGTFKTSEDRKPSQAYSVWTKILKRCYNTTEHGKPSYEGCSVAKEWHNFQNFANWYYKCHIQGWQIDKDLILFGNKEYCKEYCSFVPAEINSFFPRQFAQKSLPGVSPTSSGKFMAQVGRDGGKIYSKVFERAEDAYLEYCKMKDEDARRLAEKWKGRIDLRVYKNLIEFNSHSYLTCK